MSGADIRLDGVRFAYGDMAMAFDVAIEAGSLVAVIGPSGSGKSTLLNLIAGFEQPSAGRIVIGGRDVTALAPAERPVSMLFQDHNLFAHLDAETNVALGIAPSGRIGEAERKRVRQALVQVGLSGFEGRLPGELSGGERQRVALARVLVRDKPVLLLDEAFAGLGPALRREAIGMVRDLQRANVMTVLMVTHLPDDARLAASHTAFLKDGEIRAYGATGDVLGSGAGEDLLAYLGEG